MDSERSHILITGANGFIGRHLDEPLLAAGARVSRLARSTPLLGYAEGDWHILDLTDRLKVAEVFADLQPNYVIHLASSKDRSSNVVQFADIYQTNISMSLNVIEACRALKNFRRLVCLGTCDEYGLTQSPYDETQKGAPTTAYGLSKLSISQILTSLYHSHRFPSVVLRPTVVYGPGQGEEMFLPALIRSLLAGKEFAMTAGEQLRDFIYIDDVVDAIAKAIAADDQVNGEVINIGMGVSYSIKEIADLVAGSISPASYELIRLGAVQYRPNEMMGYSVAIARAQSLLGWTSSTSLENGIRQTVAKYRSFYA